MRAVLTYHSIDDSGSAISVAPDAFARDVRWLASGRVRVVPMADLMTLPGSDDAVALTFDDAFENFATVAAPQLSAYGLPATLFVVSTRAGLTNEWRGRMDPAVPTLPLLGWPALERLAAEGFEIGAHTRSHPDLTRLSAAELEDEISGCAEDCRARTGIIPRSFAYPYGRVSAREAATAAAAYERACTTELRSLAEQEPRERIPRLDMYYFQAPGRLQSWGTPRFSRYVRLRRSGRMIRSLFSGGTATAGI